MVCVKEFIASGRLRVIVATPSSPRSTRTVVYSTLRVSRDVPLGAESDVPSGSDGPSDAPSGIRLTSPGTRRPRRGTRRLATMADKGEYPIKLGTLLFTMVEPHKGHELEYNRWYEHDHFYAGCMIA